MTFACKNYDLDNDACQKLHSDCIPGRPGCVLFGRVKVSPELEKRIKELDDKNKKIGKPVS